MSGKFWGTGDSDSEDDFAMGSGSEGGDDDAGAGSDDDDAGAHRGGGGRWMVRGLLDSDDEDDAPERRRVRTASQKAQDDLRAALSELREHTSVTDVNAVLAAFEHLQKAFGKAGDVGLKPFPPREYLRALVLLEDWTKEVAEDKERKRASGSKPFLTLRNKLRKAAKAHEADIAAFRAKSDDAADESSDDEEEEEEEKKKPAATVSFGDSSDEDEESEDDDVYRGEDQDAASKWKVKGPRISEDAAATEARKLRKEQKRAAQLAAAAQAAETAPAGAAAAAAAAEAGAAAPATEEKPLTDDDIATIFGELAASVGKRGTDHIKVVRSMHELVEKAKAPLLRLRLLITACAAQITAATNTTVGAVVAFMPVSMWRRLRKLTAELLDLLTAEPEYRLVGQAEADADEDAAKAAGDPSRVRKVVGSMLSLVERLDDEMLLSFQNMDSHKPEYAARLSDEAPLQELMQRAQAYHEMIGDNAAAVRIAARLAEHIYHSPATQMAQLQKLASFIYKHGDERLKARVVLFQVYLHAAQGRYHEARDLLLRTHLPEGVPNMDIPTQILYNRTTVQIGLCAFRLGLIAEAHSCLTELYSSSASPRELLGQGISQPRYTPGAPMPERDPRQEAEERKRLVPHHLNISLDIVEAANHVSAMLIEIPAAATGASTNDPRRRAAGKSFRRLLEAADRQLFSGPPQSAREVVLAASRALQTGDWRRCAELVLGMKVWAQLPNPDAVKALLRQRIQEDSLRMFLLTNAQHFQSVLVATLAEAFELPEATVRCIVSRMIITEELHASFDQPTASIVPQHAEPNRLQTLALSLADKVAAFVESNERLLDARTGTYRYEQKQQDQPASLWAPRSHPRARAPGSHQQQGQGRGSRPSTRAGTSQAPPHHHPPPPPPQSSV